MFELSLVPDSPGSSLQNFMMQELTDEKLGLWHFRAAAFG